MSDPEIVRVDLEPLFEGTGEATPGKFAEIFEDYGYFLLQKGFAQRLGNDIYPYPGYGRVVVKERRKRQGRVTYVRRIGPPIQGNDFPITHEIHFPSVDSDNRNFEVAEALFAENEFGPDGKVVNRYTFHRFQLHPNDLERERFLEELFED